MKKIQITIVILVLLLLVGCNDKRFMKVEQQQPFIASVNILEPSLTFFDEFGDQLANWSLEKAYTGAILVGFDSVLLFGHQLTQADLYELSSGQLVRSIDTGIGVTNAYYDEISQFIFMTNGKTNELTSYTAKGIFQHKEKLGNYPMSMVAANNQLYIVNYKDTILSIVDTKTLENGLQIDPTVLADFFYIGIDLDKALENPGSVVDVILRTGDEIVVPQMNNTVKISGGVFYPNTVAFDNSMSWRDYVRQAGGFTKLARKDKTYAVYMNGKVQVGGRIKTEPGMEIVVPERNKDEEHRLSAVELASIASSTTSIATLVASLLKLFL